MLMGIKHMYGNEQTSEAEPNSSTNKTDDVHCWYFHQPPPHPSPLQTTHSGWLNCLVGTHIMTNKTVFTVALGCL